ncbi:hypothetical protein Tfer_0871 [Thermincola ferriacetica]|uniref:Uncharacterized protein n=1 Tax=Thermincola ferriacetica TaxID=281456 RepID=A0A0L6W4B1_9FIRM|nr:hypothetical protein [Thermincola ferriacetica]KNZ70311.1 hypothetical protein Tfer_0871 [Thermincola ferriacetica]
MPWERLADLLLAGIQLACGLVALATALLQLKKAKGVNCSKPRRRH